MHASRFQWLGALLAVIITVHSAPVRGTEVAEARHFVLILNSYSGTSSPYVLVKRIFRSKFQGHSDEAVSFREISLETNWSHQEVREPLLLETINKLFTDPSLDLVVAMGPPAANFWLRNRGKLSVNPSFIAIGGENRYPVSEMGPGDGAVLIALDMADFIDNILLVKPDTSHVLMVFGSSPYERSLAELAKVQLERFRGRVRFEYTNEMRISSLQDRLSGLGTESAVFFGQLNYDISGLSLQEGEGLQIVRANSSAPVFGAIEEQLGQGIVGGRLIDQTRMGETAAKIATQLLHQQNTGPVKRLLELRQMGYDWRELKAFAIPQKQLPEGSIIKFKVESFWEKYWHWLILVMLVIALQSMLIYHLYVARRKCRIEERAQAYLSGQLINAHEDQRKAIARELHDDLSQRLTRLAIDATIIGSRQKDDQVSSGIRKLHQDIVDVSKDVHDMSYWLHPSILDDLGLETAVRTELEQVSRHSNAKIDVQIGPLDDAMTPDSALCTFRIAQEAIQNAVKHADATHIELNLAQEEKSLKLEVSDNGKGFRDPGVDKKVGIGLSSMNERARLLGGKLQVNSVLGRGTTVSASIPSNGVNP